MKLLCPRCEKPLEDHEYGHCPKSVIGKVDGEVIHFYDPVKERTVALQEG